MNLGIIGQQKWAQSFPYSSETGDYLRGKTRSFNVAYVRFNASFKLSNEGIYDAHS
jgi:hypothetical protein